MQGLVEEVTKPTGVDQGATAQPAYVPPPLFVLM